MPFNSEAASEAGRKSGERRRLLAELREQDPDEYVRETFGAKKVELAQELLDAALGQGAWHDLQLDKRLSALNKALEYAVGRPTTRKDEDKAPEVVQGLSIE